MKLRCIREGIHKYIHVSTLTVWPELLCSVSVWWQLPRGSWCIWSVTAILWPGSGWSPQPRAAARLSAAPGEPPGRPWKILWSFRSSTGPGLRWPEAGSVCRRPGPAPDSEALGEAHGTCWRTPHTSTWKHRFGAVIWTENSLIVHLCSHHFSNTVVFDETLMKPWAILLPQHPYLLIVCLTWLYRHSCHTENLNDWWMSMKRSLPGWITCSTDTNCLQHPTGSQLLHCPLRVKTIREDFVLFLYPVKHNFNWKCCTRTELWRPTEDLHKSLLEVVGFDAADIVGSGAVQGVHQHL